MASETEPRTAESEGSRSFFINPNFARLWLGQTLSKLGDIIFEITLVVWIAADLGKGQGWAAYAVSGLLAAQAIPVLLVGPFAGALVDRWRDKRHVLLVADLISAGLILGLIPLAGIVHIPGVGVPPLAWRLAAIFVIVFLSNIVAQFFSPASSVVLRDIVPEPDLPRAAGHTQATSSLSLLLGPPLAAPLLFTFGADWALVINAASFVVSFVCNRSLRLPSIPTPETANVPALTPRDLLSEIGDGLRFFRRSRVLMTMAIAISAVMLAAGAINSLDVFFITENLGTPAKSYGFLSSAQGAGLLIGSLAWGWIAGRLGLARTFWIGLASLGVILMVYARMTSFSLGLAALFALGLINPAVNVVAGPIMYRVTPRAFIGRVSATLYPLMNVALLVGMFGAGILYGSVMRDLDATLLGIHFGPIDTIFLGAGFLALLGGLFAATLRLPEAAPERGAAKTGD